VRSRGPSPASSRSARQLRREAVCVRLGWEERPIVPDEACPEQQGAHLLLVEVRAAMLSTDLTAQLVLVGPTKQSSRAARGLIDELAIGAAGTCLGVHTDVPDLFGPTHTFTFSSLYEGLGGAVVESLGVKVPIVASDVPAAREVLGGTYPWFMPIGDSIALSQAVIQVPYWSADAEDVAAGRRTRFHEQCQMRAAVVGMDRLYRDVGASVQARRRHRLARAPRVRV
jgi:glycosyltransferase involved in cell wall biosynthesis